MTEESPEVVSSLSARPLTFGEVEHLAEGVPESMKIAPGSGLKTP